MRNHHRKRLPCITAGLVSLTGKSKRRELTETEDFRAWALLEEGNQILLTYAGEDGKLSLTNYDDIAITASFNRADAGMRDVL